MSQNINNIQKAMQFVVNFHLLSLFSLGVGDVHVNVGLLNLHDTSFAIIVRQCVFLGEPRVSCLVNSEKHVSINYRNTIY